MCKEALVLVDVSHVLDTLGIGGAAQPLMVYGGPCALPAASQAGVWWEGESWLWGERQIFWYGLIVSVCLVESSNLTKLCVSAK